MTHLSRESTRAFDLHDVTFTSFASTASGAADIAAWRVDVPPDTPGQPHTMSCEEVLHVLSGQLHAEIDGESHVVPAGDALLVPPGAVLRIGTGPEPASAWVTTLIGMTASMSSGEQVTPPWAQ